jgi:hypothetical protein
LQAGKQAVEFFFVFCIMKCEFEQLVIWLFSGMMGMILEDSIKAC